MIKTVRAALEPGANAATKQEAAAILRSVLGMLDGGAQATSSTTPATLAPAADSDLLGRIIEYVRPYVPEEALREMPRFRVPLVPVGRDH